MDRTALELKTAAPPTGDEASALRFRDPREDGSPRPRTPVYAALDLGTNNCRLLIARQPIT